MTSPVFLQIENDIKNHDVVLYMKGSRVFPQCGFSATVVGILEQLGVKYRDIDILQDPGLRQGIKEFTNWPTIPQLYIKGEFIGGCDIIREIYESGELLELLNSHSIKIQAQA